MLSAEYIHKYNGISSVLKPSNKKTRVRRHGLDHICLGVTQVCWECLHKTFGEKPPKGLRRAPRPLKHTKQLSGPWCMFLMDATAHQAKPLLLFYHSLSKQRKHTFWFFSVTLQSGASLFVRQWLSHSHSTRKLPNLCLPIPLLFSLILFRFYPFSLIVCNSYQVSLRPTSAASRSAARRAKCLLSAFYWLPGRRVVVVQCNLGTPITGFNKSSCFLMVVKPLSSFPPFSKCVGWLE